MAGIDKDLHWPWLGFALEQAIGRGLYTAKDVVGHATPEVLVSQLPQDVMVAMFARALANGTLTPASVLETAPPNLLAEHLEPEVMWRCLKETAERNGLSERGKPRTESARQWLASILQGALETELLAAADVMRHLPPAEFVRDTPLPVMAELIKAGLLGGKFDPALVLQHLTPQVIAENLESSLAWACISEAALQRFELPGAGAQITSIGAAPTKAPRDEENTGKIAVGAPAMAKANGGGMKETRIDPVAPKHKGKSTPNKAEDWATHDDLDVVEESPLPPPPVVRKA